ncbi:MAG: histidine kinase, partial [Opitutaceae bacterium]|nr:histidine kinase [Opitutaceae bacterium]
MSFPPAAVAFVLLATSGGVGAATAGEDYGELLQAASTASNLRQPEYVDRATAVRVQADGMDEIPARIAVYRDLAAVFAGREAWADAAAQIGTALTLARPLGEPDLIISLYLEEAGHRYRTEDQSLVRPLLDAADAMISKLGRRAAWTESRLLRAASLSRDRQRHDHAQADAIYESLLAEPDADRFRIELHRARHTRFDRSELFTVRWTTVLGLARERADAAVEAEACDQLGNAAHARGDHQGAARLFARAEESSAPPPREVQTWLRVVTTYNLVDDRPRAHRALSAAAKQIDDRNPGAAADLHEARGTLLGRERSFEEAYRELARAMELRRRRDATRQAIPFARIAPMTSRRNTETAAELAAVRNALREAELGRTQLLQRQTAGLATVAVLLAALLGLAYAYKRRSAAALAIARHNAELRADRTHWQMLRYQLNPHFLFNALSSLGGLVATDPPAAGRVIERLSEFCQLALKGSSEDLRTLAHELEIIRAYLDVEQAGAGDTLSVRFDIAPAALPCLVPPLLLQPLVENALKYGGETSADHLEVTVTARRSADGATLEIEVANTGRWIERERGSRPR